MGSHLLHRLIKSNAEVIAIYRNKNNIKITEDIFQSYGDEKLADRINWVQGDILNPAFLSKVLVGVRYVYHSAAMVSFDPRDRDELMNININGTANVVNVCLENDIKKLCYVSSVGAFGKAKRDKKVDENTHWENDSDPSGYSISKFHAEMEVWRGIEEGLNAVIVNPATILGEGNWDRGSSRIFGKIHEGLSFYTNGYNGYVDVRDVVEIMILLMNGSVTKERFLLVSENWRYPEFLGFICEQMNRKEPKYEVGKKLAQIAVIWERIISTFSGNPPLITRETAKIALSEQQYSNQRITERLNYRFIPLKETLKRVSKAYLDSFSSDS